MKNSSPDQSNHTRASFPAIEILSELPREFLVQSSPLGLLAVHREIAPALADAGFGPETDGRMAISDLAGRRKLGELAFGDQRLLVRRFTHGGLLRFATGDRFMDPARPFRELVLTWRLRLLGIPVAEVLGARARRAGLRRYRLDLITRRIEGAVDLAKLLSPALVEQLRFSSRAALARAAAGLISSMHACGLIHVDLNARNLLASIHDLAGKNVRMWVVDLDRCWLDQVPLGLAQRLLILRRFYRSFVRLARAGRAMPTRGDCARFLRAYDESSWRSNWRAIAGAHAAAAPLHNAGWILERGLHALHEVFLGRARTRR